jgi:hypothetical protein
MATRQEEMQRIIRLYKEETGIADIDMRKVAMYAHDKGWPLPKQTDPVDILASQFAQAAREEVKRDRATGKPYRVNHALTMGQTTFWFDIDDPAVTRKKMHLSLTNRRQQMVADGLQLSLDADHWNRIHPAEEPIQMEMDFSLDVEWAKNAMQDKGIRRSS